MNLYDDNGKPVGLYELAEYWFYHYPKDVFESKPEPIVRIREAFEEIIAIRDDKRNG